MASAQAEIEIEAPLKTVYEVISDFESYPDFLPETKKVKILHQNAKSAEVKFTISLIKKISYTLDIALSSPKGLTWNLIEGDLMKKNKGKWKLTHKKGVTTAIYEIDMEFSGLVPKAISNKLIGSSLPSMLRAFRDRAEEIA